MKRATAALTVVMAMVVSGQAIAQEAQVHETQDERLAFDLEIDPLAYALGGHSLHAGIWWDNLRVDLGAFALDMPEQLHGNSGFEASFAGYGTKVDVFFGDDRDGLFTGVEASVTDVLIARDGEASRHTQVNVGGRVGYRWLIAGGFYAEPWVGVGYAFNAKDVELQGERYENNPLLIFPTVHLGYMID